ncbi:peptide chain release factor N(5)-glutamine methyltransferase [Intrasporangium flavum]|uniref:peptide chain release factor N(5)-glutamine methyltransferase n=1 Tax=Intrasporangium flavum TaxID=1428657 RepID=UPI00096D2033|nr:peptide chain release factor N(5)-glutamine methyltransferase [Intrasporangium flavum]
MTDAGTDLRTGVRAAARDLAEAGVPSPDADALELAAHVLGLDTGEVRRRMVLGGTTLPDAYGRLVDERAARVPLQHLTGRAHFRRLTLSVGPGVFVPRPETEVLVDLALAEVDRLTAAGPAGAVVRFVDLCSGSGAIPLAVKDERPDVEVRGVELSAEAHAWSVANRDRLGLDVDLVEGDASGPCLPDWEGSVDVLTVNPPYIPVGQVPLDPEVRDHDPELALYGGSEDGLAIPLAVARRAADLLRPGGLLLVEHADSQGRSLPARLARTGLWVEVADHADLTGRPRVTTARRRASDEAIGQPSR